MTYGSTNIITSLDYNTFAQGGASPSNAVANINTIWGVGIGDKGYGQSTTLSNVTSVTSTVTATQWATLISRLNSILTHQSGSGSGLVPPTTGNVVTYLSSLSGNITTAFTNRLNSASNATDVTTTATNTVWNSSAPTTQQIIKTATWASADQARYFFNAGGKLILTFGTVVNTLGNAKGTDWATLLNTKLATLVVGSYTNGRTGTGGTITASNTSIGYWNAGTTNNSAITLTSASGTADYSSNSVVIGIKTNGVQGANGDVGTVVTFQIDLTDAAADTNTAPAGIPVYNPVGTAPTQGNFNDALNLTIPVSITIRPPETTNLSTAITNPTIA